MSIPYRHFESITSVVDVYLIIFKNNLNAPEHFLFRYDGDANAYNYRNWSFEL